MTIEATHMMETNDADLVAESRDGSRDAFRQIVERYQTLICSLAYSAIGNVSQSEDVAQETFLTAWTDLRSLREPNKLRAWLCGIVRNRIHKSLQREGREPVHDAMPLEDAHDSPAREALPSEQAISREEEAILWRSLERIPEIYREPLILFYRKHQSIESVAAELELSEDAVKQRLSRGRKLLQEEVQAFVESTLRRTAPGEAFSTAVFAALPLATGSTATVGMGMGAKGTAAAKSGFFAAWLMALLPFIGILAGFASQLLVVRAITTGRERRAKTIKFIVFWLLAPTLAVAGESAIKSLSQHFEWSDRVYFAARTGFWWFYAIAIATWFIVTLRQLQAARQRSPEATEAFRLAMTTLKPSTLVISVAGAHLAMFSWLIFVAWFVNDHLWAGIISGLMVVLAVWQFCNRQGKVGLAGVKHMACCFAVILIVLNLRLDVWMASRRSVSLAEIHALFPPWIIPTLTLALITWIGIVWAVTKPKLPDPRDGERGNSRGNNVKGLLLLMLFAGCFLTFISPTMGQSPTPLAEKAAQADATIPDQFRPLYRELDETLRQAIQTNPFNKGNTRPLVVPNLFMASSIYGPATPDSQRWKDLLATLDAFKAMGVDGVSVMILAPDLTDGDPKSLIGFYQRLAREIHSRNMKLYVEHFVNMPFKSNVPSRTHAQDNLRDDPEGRQDFLKILEQEDTLIYREVKPDYLSLLTEPYIVIVHFLHLSFSADELAAWVGRVATNLKASGASPDTLLGAGALTYEPEDFILKFAQQSNLDYVDIHLYPLNFNGQDQVVKLAALVRTVRKARPNMKVTIGETWLWKHGAEEPKAIYKEAFFRDNFSFWSPLDDKFLDLVMGIAQKENISVVAPYFSQYFFTYYSFGDAESSKLPPWPNSVPVSWNKALGPIRNHQFSPTGKAMSEMLDTGGK